MYSYLAYVFRRFQNNRHTKLCLNRLWVKELIVLVGLSLVVLIVELFNLAEIA
jgi:hypothetical protein